MVKFTKLYYSKVKNSLQTLHNMHHSHINFLPGRLQNDRKGSAVVEAVLTVPIFICAVCTLMAIGQMLFAQVQILQALSQTADQYAQIREIRESDSLEGTAYVYTAFRSMMEDKELCSTCVKGGINGIVLSQSAGKDQISVTATYFLKLPVPYFSKLGFGVKKTIGRRIFSGYIAHEGDSSQEDPVVYITEHGYVYHTTLECSKICIKISDQNLINAELKTKKYPPCQKCMRSGVKYSQLYITVSGDACHSTLLCSGLKRTIKAVRLSEVKGRRACKNCGSK